MKNHIIKVVIWAGFTLGETQLCMLRGTRPHSSVEIAELDMEGMRAERHSFENVVIASQYEDDEGKYEEKVVVEYKDEDGNIVDDTIRSHYGARIIHIEE